MKRKQFLSALILASALAWVTPIDAYVFEVDPAHSEISFSIRHMALSSIRGHFTQFEGTFNFDPKNPTKNTLLSGKITANSIDTRNKKRDDHLRSADFFDTENHPDITFKSVTVSTDPMMSDMLYISGDLTIHGITRAVSTTAVLSGPITEKSGIVRIGLSGEFSINRQDFGIVWNKTLDSGGLIIDNHVVLQFSFEAKAKADGKSKTKRRKNR
jgi:polyisoprenoid-binding protein YceI